MDLQDVRLDIADAIAVVRLARPPVNAFNDRLVDEVIHAFDLLNDRLDVHAVILTGEGKVFSAGADTKAWSSRTGEPGEQWALLRRFRAMYDAIKECRKPVIAALNGPALGGGLMVACLCDILVASTTATVSLPEVDVGVVGGGRAIREQFGRSQARHMIFTGAKVPAAELYRLGVVQACVPPAELMEAALGIARTIAAKPPTVLRLVKIAANATEEMSPDQGARLENDLYAELKLHK